MELFNRYSMAVALAVIFFSATTAFGQTSTGKNNGAYSAGYREYKATDSSRRYKPGAVAGNQLYYRPEEIDVWYPARTGAGDRPLDFYYFLSLFERRANSFQD